MHRLAVLVVALLLAVAVAGCSVISLDLSPRIRPLEEQVVEGRGAAKILLMDVSGFLSDEAPSGLINIGTPPPTVPPLVRLREELTKAADDGDVKALVVKINTPGGTVSASDIMYREVESFRQTTKKPVIAIMMDVAASGGYYLALAADSILAHPTTITGSIGVIMLTLNAEGLLQKIGVGATAIKSAERKDMGSPFRSLLPEERAIFQSVIDDFQRQFLAKVVDRRRLPAGVVRTLADGRVYTAQQALEHKLIDRIGYVPDALEAARKAAGLEDASIIVYKRPRQYRATYYATAESHPGGVEASLSHFGALMGAGPRFLYLWAP
jgi:protease-4